MINKLQLRLCSLMLFLAVSALVFTTDTIGKEQNATNDFSLNSCSVVSSRIVLEPLTTPSDHQSESALMFAQTISSCPCFSLSRIMATKWDRCVMSSLGFPRLLRRLVDSPPTEIWTINLNKLRASCECQGTPSGLCTGKGERSSEVYRDGMSDSEWMACTTIIKEVAEAQGLTCK